MIDAATLATIALMASGTYLTRILGYLALRNRSLSPRTLYVLESVPGCVLISGIAPAFVSSRPADLIALAIAIAAACRLSKDLRPTQQSVNQIYRRFCPGKTKN